MGPWTSLLAIGLLGGHHNPVSRNLPQCIVSGNCKQGKCGFLDSSALPFIVPYYSHYILHMQGMTNLSTAANIGNTHDMHTLIGWHHNYLLTYLMFQSCLDQAGQNDTWTYERSAIMVQTIWREFRNKKIQILCQSIDIWICKVLELIFLIIQGTAFKHFKNDVTSTY